MASAVALAISAGDGAWAAPDLLFQRLLESPDDPLLNRQFAAEAEARGDIRHAVAAMERARNARPDDPEIAAEHERLRRKMLPTVTVVVAQTGLSAASNSHQLPSSSDRRHLDGIVDAAVAIEDERTVHDVRLRSRFAAQGQGHWKNTDLTSGQVSVESGPVYQLNQNLWLYTAPGTSAAWLDGRRLFNEASLSATLGSVVAGQTQTASIRYGWRRGNEEIQNADSHVFDIDGRFVMSPSLVTGDFLYFQPRARLNRAIDPLPGVVVGHTEIGELTPVTRDLSPWSYREIGARTTYFFPVFSGRALLGAGFSLINRNYLNGYVLDPVALVSGVHVSTNEKRQDLLFEPTAHAIFPNLIGPALDMRMALFRLSVVRPC